MRSPFVINVSTIAGKGGYRLEDVDVVGPLEALKVTGSHVGADTPVLFSGHIEATTDSRLVAEGDVATSWVGECRRCLGPADGDIQVHVREIFEKSPTEGVTYGIDGDNVDLEPLVREAVMLELPTAPLCRPDCAGLCPQCGANRNEVDCGHKPQVTDDRWAALDQLLPRSE